MPLLKPAVIKSVNLHSLFYRKSPKKKGSEGGSQQRSTMYIMTPEELVDTARAVLEKVCESIGS